MALAIDSDDRIAAAVAQYQRASDTYSAVATRARALASAHERYDRATIAPLMRCVVLLDDDHGARAALAAILRSALGVDVYEAVTTTDALALVAAHRPAVVVVDYLLRAGNSASSSGLAFVEALPRVHRAAIVSGHADLDALAGPLTALGVRAYTRPVTARDAGPLVEHVRALLDAAAPPPPPTAPEAP